MVMSLLHVYKCVGVCVWVISTAPGGMGMAIAVGNTGGTGSTGGRSDIRHGSGRGGDSIPSVHGTVWALVVIIAAGQYDKEGDDVAGPDCSVRLAAVFRIGGAAAILRAKDFPFRVQIPPFSPPFCGLLPEHAAAVTLYIDVLPVDIVFALIARATVDNDRRRARRRRMRRRMRRSGGWPGG